MFWARKIPPVRNIMFADLPPNVPQPFVMHWTERKQPDLGGALNYSWDAFQRPVKEMLGTSMAPSRMPRPIGQPPMEYQGKRPLTGMGVYTGNIVHQPLTDPSGPAGGGYTGNPPQLSQGLA